MPADALYVRDKLVADFTGAEKANGLLPDPGKAERIAADLLSGAFDAPVRRDPVPGPAKVPTEERLAERGATLLTEADIAALEAQRPRKPTTRSERIEAWLAYRRMKQLQAIPEWHAKMMAAGDRGYQAWRLAIARGEADADLTIFCARERMAVLDESNRIFGDWTRLPAGRRITTVGMPAKGA